MGTGIRSIRWTGRAGRSPSSSPARYSRCTKRVRTACPSPIAIAWPAIFWRSAAADLFRWGRATPVARLPHVQTMTRHWSGAPPAELPFRALAHQGLALALGDDLAALVGGSVAEFDDAGVRPRLALTAAQHRGADLERVAVEYRLGELHVGHAEVCDGGADRGVVHRDADHQPQGEQAVDDALAELGLFRELLVEVQRLHVHGQRAVKNVVHFRHGARPGVIEHATHVQF